MTPEVIIADTGGANVASLRFALERLGATTRVTDDGSAIASADRVVLPGVGAAGHAMRRLRDAGLINVIRTLTQPVLGICLGMQLLYQDSEEGHTKCLGLLPGIVHRIHGAPGRPVPHMGWNRLRPNCEDPLLEGITDQDYAYFVHTYAVPVNGETLAETQYGNRFSAVVRRKNFCGAQFHPERSGKAGARLLENFLRL
jgi:imidazole glycerol-phosphate synthase subunit HisH